MKKYIKKLKHWYKKILRKNLKKSWKDFISNERVPDMTSVRYLD